MLLYSAITGVITVLAAYVLLPFYIPVLLSYLLKDHDVQLHTLEMGYPSLQGVRIKTLDMSYQNSERFLFERGFLSYNTNNEFSLLLDAVHHSHTNKKFPQTSIPTEAFIRTEYLPSVLLSKIPKLDIRIANITNSRSEEIPLSSTDASDSANRSISVADIVFSGLTLAIDRDGLTGYMQLNTIVNDLQVSHEFNVSASANNDITFAINKKTKDTPWFDISGTFKSGIVKLDLIKEKDNKTDNEALLGKIKTSLNLVDIAELLPEPTIQGEVTVESSLSWSKKGAGLSGLNMSTQVDATIQRQDNTQLNTSLYLKADIDNTIASINLFDSENLENYIQYSADTIPTLDLVFNKTLNVELDLATDQLAIKSPLASQLFFSTTQKAGKELEKTHLASIVQHDIDLNTATDAISFNLNLLLKGEALSQFTQVMINSNRGSENKSDTQKMPKTPIFSEQKDIVLDALITANNHASTIVLTRDNVIDLSIQALLDSGFSDFQLILPPQEFIINYPPNALNLIDGKIISNVNLYYEPEKIQLASRIDVSSSGQKIHTTLTSEPFTMGSNKLPGFLFNASFATAIDATIATTYSTAPDNGQTDTLNAEFSLENMCQQRLLEGQWQSSGDVSQLAIESNAFFSKNSSSKHWLNIDKLPMEVTKGELNAKIHVNIDGDVTTVNGYAELINADFIGEFGSFDGVQLRFSAPKSHFDHTKQHYDFRGDIATANVGVDVTDIQLAGYLGNTVDGVSNGKNKTKNVDGAPWYISLNKSTASIFGGIISVQPGRINLDDSMNFKVNLKDIDLSKIVETQQIDGLQTTGKISGTLPVNIQVSSPLIEGGKLYNNDGGLIRYSTPLNGSADLNEQLKLTLDVLENFNYEILDTSVNFKDGNLIFQSKISGQNPDVAGGQKIDLNLNTEVDMTSTIELLRLQSGLEAEIEQLLNNNLGAQSNINICEQRL